MAADTGYSKGAASNVRGAGSAPNSGPAIGPGGKFTYTGSPIANSGISAWKHVKEADTGRADYWGEVQETTARNVAEQATNMIDWIEKQVFGEEISEGAENKTSEQQAAAEKEFQEKSTLEHIMGRRKKRESARNEMIQTGPVEGGGDQDLNKVITLATTLFSDPRLKKNIKQVDESPSGIPIYEFEYKTMPGRYKGALTTEVPEHALVKNYQNTGYDAVKYDEIDVNFEKL